MLDSDQFFLNFPLDFHPIRFKAAQLPPGVLRCALAQVARARLQTTIPAVDIDQPQVTPGAPVYDLAALGDERINRITTCLMVNP
jgi:hypothetical protein